MSRKINLSAAPRAEGTLYPPPYDEPCRARRRIKLGDAAGLTQFGVNLCTLPPGTWSSQRHWHSKSDEFVYVVAGEVVLVTGDGEEILRAGDSAGFKAGDRNGHHFQNRSASDALIMEIGTRAEGDEAFYPEIDLRTVAGQGFAHRDGTPYPKAKRST
ncbi:MAG TPA: cupin domain-containing protein [Candidatus Acidoferrales bacterium]|nr:cupin domain-containing protein [Candidatus Acidoferrales bacterium]